MMLARVSVKRLEQCLFSCGDNSSVNHCLATLMLVPLVGYLRNRRSLAVREALHRYMEEQGLMLNLQTLTQSAKCWYILAIFVIFETEDTIFNLRVV